MKKLIYLLLLALMSAACEKVDKSYIWTGEKEVSAEGGSVKWTPKVEDPHHWPEILAVVAQVYDETGNEVIESKIFENPDLEVEGEWYKVTGKLNEVIVEFKQNTTPFPRSITVTLKDPFGGFSFGVNQNAGI